MFEAEEDCLSLFKANTVKEEEYGLGSWCCLSAEKILRAVEERVGGH